MEILQIYAIAAGGVFSSLIVVNLLIRSPRFVNAVSLLICKYLTYLLLLRRHRFAGPWTPAGILFRLSYITVVAFCLGFREPSISATGLRSGYLALINLIPLFSGPYLSFLADLLGISLPIYWRLHRLIRLMSYALVLVHVFIAIMKRQPFALNLTENLYGLITGSALSLLLILSFPIFRRPSYEVFLRVY
ncbi:hypothetical protein VTN77DRAFT_7377 [Rasamsonia byssochlamydoides]|uniref:uncharacterized protein n=1 Tax=Rasamsonia byssochlamydoides TaxID=89139 RepID=UPI0037448620